MSPNKHVNSMTILIKRIHLALARWHDTFPCIYLTAKLGGACLEVDKDKYHHLIPVCLLGLTVFKKCNAKTTRITKS